MIPLVMSVIAKTETFQRDMAKAGASVNKFSTTASRTTATVTKLGRSFLMMAGVGGGLYMFSNVLRSGIREAAAFEKQMAMVSTMLDQQSMSILPHYKEQLRAMSKEFGEGTETLSKGLYDILSASIAPAKALNVLAVAAKAAKGGMTDTGTAADALTTILNSYGLSAERAGDVSDKMFAIVKRGKTTYAELAPNIGKIASLAATAGVSFDDLGASIATMTRAGVQTEIAITSLRAVILGFLKPMPDAIEMAKKFDIVLSSATLSTEGLRGVVQKLSKATAEQLAIIFPTSRALAGFTANIRNASGLTEDFERSLGALGLSQEAYMKMVGTDEQKLAQLNQQWIDMKKSIGELTTGPLIGFLEKVTWYFNEIGEAAGNIKKAIDSLNKSVPNQNYGSWAPMPQAERPLGPSAEGAAMKLQLQREQVLAMMLAMEKGGLSAGAVSSEIKAPPGTGGADNAEVNQKILDDEAKAAEKRIQITARMYEDMGQYGDGYYQAQVALLDLQKAEYGEYIDDKVLLEEWYANELKTIQEKIRVETQKLSNAQLSIWERAMQQREELWRDGLTRIEAMERDQMEIMNSFMDGIESSWVNFWDPVIDGSKSAEEAMNDFFRNFLIKLIQAKAQMIMLNLWNAGAGNVFGGIGAVLHSGWVPEGVPSFQRGRGLKSNEMAAIIEKDEMLVPNKQIVKGVSSGSANYEPKFNIIIVRDEKAAQIEAMNSKEGEKSYIRHANRNRNI